MELRCAAEAFLFLVESDTGSSYEARLVRCEPTLEKDVGIGSRCCPRGRETQANGREEHENLSFVFFSSSTRDTQ